MRAMPLICTFSIVLHLSSQARPIEPGSSVVVLADRQVEAYRDLAASVGANLMRFLQHKHEVLMCGGTRLKTLLAGVQGRRVSGGTCQADYAVRIHIQKYSALQAGVGQGRELPRVASLGAPDYGRSGMYPTFWPGMAPSLPKTRHRLWVAYDVYDLSTGKNVMSSVVRAGANTRLQSASSVQERLARNVASDIARAICRGRYPDVIAVPVVAAVAPFGGVEDAFSISTESSSGWSIGAEVACILARVIGLSVRYDYQRFDMDKLSLGYDRAYYQGNDYHFAAMLGKRYGIGAMGYVFPHGALGFNVSRYDIVIHNGAVVGMTTLEPTAMVTLGGGCILRPGSLPLAFSVSAEAALGRSAYADRVWDQMRLAFEDEGISVPADSPDFNVSHLRLALSLGYAL